MPQPLETGERPRKKPKQEIHWTEPKKLGALGINIGVDKLNLANDFETAFRLVDPQTRNQQFFRVHHHPFSGEHLSEFMTQTSPFKRYGSKAGVKGDLRMPIDAKKGRETGRVEADNPFDEMKLDRLHRNDPEIGSSYAEFVDKGVPNRFLKALFHSASDSVFDELRRVAFVRGKESYVDNLFRQCERALQQRDFEQIDDILSAAYFYPYGETGLFRTYFGERQGLTQDVYTAFYNLKVDDRIELLTGFLQSLTSDQRLTYALMFYDRTLIDLDAGEIIRGGSTGAFTKLLFTDGGTIEISNKSGTIGKAGPGAENYFGQIDWRASSYEFSPSYQASAIYPVLAWEKTAEGQRRFLDQREVTQVLHSKFRYSKWGDAKLGVILAAYCSPDVTKNWPALMRLEGGGRNQRMMGAQMLLWPTLDTEKHPHATELLNSEDSIIPKLEKLMEEAA